MHDAKEAEKAGERSCPKDLGGQTSQSSMIMRVRIFKLIKTAERISKGFALLFYNGLKEFKENVITEEHYFYLTFLDLQLIILSFPLKLKGTKKKVR